MRDIIERVIGLKPALHRECKDVVYTPVDPERAAWAPGRRSFLFMMSAAILVPALPSPLDVDWGKHEAYTQMYFLSREGVYRLRGINDDGTDVAAPLYLAQSRLDDRLREIFDTRLPSVGGA